ncbi:radical SAM family heme chaperone HemW [Candidatus Fermentibacteria bacterium]|nr:radical SAM family heme chaperone HemW [Candidatus Fermentibacteria bacterium]
MSEQASEAEKTEYGLYFHFPFCLRKCRYCSFFSDRHDNQAEERYFESLLRELTEHVPEGLPLRTFYVGGGTPTLLEPSKWKRLREVTDRHLDTSGVIESTIETNPATSNELHLGELLEAGFDRLSVGVQSLRDVSLRILGRPHTAQEAVQTIRTGRKVGFQRLSFDLIYGIPDQTLEMFREDLQKAIDIAPEHVSCYELSLDEGTEMAGLHKVGVVKKPDEDVCKEMYLLAHEMLTSNGYLHYEVSNYALGEDNTSVHNFCYWRLSPYHGLGPSAHSFDGNRDRWWNVSDNARYVEMLKQGRPPTEERETLTAMQMALELLMLGLRIKDGVNLREVAAKTGLEITPQGREHLEQLRNQGMLTIEEDRIRPTVKGMLFADGMARDLSEHMES